MRSPRWKPASWAGLAPDVRPSISTIGFEAGQGRRRGQVVAVVTGPEEHDEQHHAGDQEVHGRAGQRHRQPAPQRRLAVGAGLVGRVDLLQIVHAEDPAVAAERQGLDPVFRLAPPDRPQAGAEADEELGDLDARRLGRGVVAELVGDDAADQGQDQQHGLPGSGREAETDDRRH